MLLKMKDDYIVNILYDSTHISGCETCDYGSEYIREFWVVLQYRVIYVCSNTMYGFACSEDFLFKLFLRNVDKIRKMSRSEFLDFLREEMDKTESDDLLITLSDSWEYNSISSLFNHYIKQIEESIGFDKEDRAEAFKGTCAKEAAEYLNKYWYRIKHTVSGTYNDMYFPESAILEYQGKSILPNRAYWLLE